MKKKILLAVAIVCLLCGCEKTIPKLADGSEAVVSFKDGSMISANELYDELKEAYATSVVMDMIDRKILEDKYSKKIEDAKEYAESTVKSIKSYYVDEEGNYDESKLLSAINQSFGFTTIEEYQDYVYVNYLRNKAIEDYAKSKVKDKEIKKYYKDEVVGDRKVSHIQIIPEVKDSMTNDEKKAKEEEALNKAKEVIAKLKKGEKFADLAKEYSADDESKEKGGSLGYINKGDFGSDEFDEKAFSIEVGKYTTTPVKTSSGYEIIYVEEEKEKEALDKVKDEIIETLANTRIDEDATVQVDAIKELRKEYGVDIIDDVVEKSYDKYMDNLYDQAQRSNTAK